MKFADYINYFKTVATNHKDLLYNPAGPTPVFSFYRMDIEEVLAGLRGKLNSTSLVVENPEIGVDDQLSDNIRQLWRGAFLIIKQAKKSDIDDEMSTLDKTKEIAEDVLSKIMNDTRKWRSNNSYPQVIKGFDPKSIRIQKVGPIFDNFYGWRTEFGLNQTFNNNLVLDPNKWNGETKFAI